MKIVKVENIICHAGWRPYTYVKITTDNGIVGYGEYGGWRNPKPIRACIEDLADALLIGRDPRPVDLHYWNMYRATVTAPGGIAQMAIAGLDCALWDVKAKALGVPVYELCGGPNRQEQRVYWSHCGTYRARNAQLLGKPPIHTWQDIYNLGQEVVQRGFTALKTNILWPGDPPRTISQGMPTSLDNPNMNTTPELIAHVVKQISVFREAVGPNIDIALDTNFNFKTEGYKRIAKALEPFNMMWLEIDTYDPKALREIKESTCTRICSCENLFTRRGYLPFLQEYAMDVAMVDVPWNGFTESKKIAEMAEPFEMNVAPHNYYSHLSSFISAQLCACVPNVKIMEIDIDDVPWKDDIVTNPPEFVNGCMKIPAGPGWGTDLNEKEIAKYPWDK
jgi:galactonate dehydratase